MGRPGKNESIVSIRKLGQALIAVGKDQEIVRKAVKENPWFSKYYIESAISALSIWFEGDEIEQLLENYLFSRSANDGLNIGLIMAGNLPLVGFHDLLITLLIGHRACIKMSHKDRLLLPAIIHHWKLADDLLSRNVFFYESLSQIDYLIATGSDNTARYIDFTFANIPRTIRKNRFSVGMLSGEESNQELELLVRDILMFDGMGCRNVSNLLVPQSFDLARLYVALENYPLDHLTRNYFEMLKWEGAEAKMLKTAEKIFSNIIISQSLEINPVKPGWLNIVKYKTIDDARAMLASSKESIQCVVGKGLEVPIGESQQPPIDAFADGVDTMRILSDL